MLLNNKTFKDQRTPRTARLKSRIEAISLQSQQFNQFCFKFPEPHTTTNSSKVVLTPFKGSYDKSTTDETYNSRRNTIKEKIKIRIKQELWSLLKKNNDKQEQIQIHNQNIQTFDHQQYADPNFGCIKGKTFTRYGRDSFHSKKNWSMVSKACKQEYDRSKAERQNTQGEKKANRRRIWSSVKMKEPDRVSFVKKSNKMCKNAFSLQKLQALQIEPWKLSDDAENHELD